MIKRTTIIETLTVLNIILFLYTGLSKIQDYRVFKEQLAESPVLAPSSSVIAILLPVFEFLVVIMLTIPRWRLKGLYATLASLVIFTGYIISLFVFNEKLPCSCGGIIELMSWQQHLVFNTLFIALAVWAIVLQKRLKHEEQKAWAHMNELIDYSR